MGDYLKLNEMILYMKVIKICAQQIIDFANVRKTEIDWPNGKINLIKT
jgi:hypothetical protein